MKAITKFLETVGRGVGNVVGVLYQSGRDSVNLVIGSVIPFMAFISMIIGIILKTGVGTWIANALSPLASTVPGLLLMSFVCTLPFLSPMLGPGAVIAQIIGTLIGVQIGQGIVPVTMALPALYAINGQAGCDFIPVAMAMGEAEPDTVEKAVPAMLFSRMITGPLAVLIGYFASFGMKF
jgi:PTS system glucitol/sorbitol-specific IIB component